MFVIVGFCVFGGIFGVAAMAVFVDHLPKLSRLGPIELGENSTRLRARLHQEAVLGRGARRDRTRREPRQRALEGHRADDAQRDRRGRGQALLAARRARLARHRARCDQQPARRAGSGRAARRISQQLAKNLYLQREASSRSISRKIDEAWIAVQLQDKYSKAEILTAY